ncbi:hypothetical protein OS175_02170 [Marinicella sp. S1101]|uniref:[protein-PII] uridylyltransferase family protein n=1 Tax=Marinicella marina TaxID=2996016 RepID=UPI002260B902|nr:hypothetical protein [Marinicella marina]MCX7552671.1 hypothetical protein [Marinicella marina]MDJ1139547.1 hypothetical protein [Marinicella marina]
MNKPDWLQAFPFINKHWRDISTLQAKFNGLVQFDIASDWQQFIQQSQQHHASFDWFHLLRLYRHSRLAYLAYQDIALPLEQHVKTMHMVSALADHLIQVAHQVAAEAMQQKHGVVLDEDGQAVELMVFALGKLGTYELNYSSDVDLVFLYEGGIQSDGKRSLAAADYFIRMGQKIIKLLDFFSQDGQVYRVDMRLRPFGSASPLACSVKALQHYILHEGRDWERFAWMRARMICGQSELPVRKIIQPFIYRRHLDYQVLDALHSIKNEIAAHSTEDADNIKMGLGGIRVVEFIIQSLQLVFGGRMQQLQGTSIHPQIHNLAALQKLNNNDAKTLENNWLMLRKIENLVQAVDDQANHEYPTDPLVQRVIAAALGFNDWQSAAAGIKTQRRQVSRVFDELFSTHKEGEKLDAKQRSVIHHLLGRLPTSRMPQPRLEQVTQLFELVIKKTQDEVVLSRFSDLLKNIINRPAYMMMLLKERNLLTALLGLLGEDAYFASSLQQHPVLLEQLFEYESFVDFDQQILDQRWKAQQHAVVDVESWMESIRQFKNVHQFNLMMAWVKGDLSDARACELLTVLAQYLLQQVVVYSHMEVGEKYPEAAIKVDDLIVIAYGSAATGEMSIHSDLDLVFVFDGLSMDHSMRQFSQRWVKRIMSHLSSQMYNGKLYDLDMQLRPNGSAGTLITTTKEFANYQHHRAWVWEHAAMIKSKVLVGNSAQKKWHQALRASVIAQPRDALLVDQAMQDMALKLAAKPQAKNHQLEFSLLATVLKQAVNHPELLQLHQIHHLQQKLSELKLLKADELDDRSTKKSPIGDTNGAFTAVKN